MRTHKIEHAPMVRLGELIEPLDRRNNDRKFDISYVRGISNSKEIMQTKADVDENVISKFYIINPGEFIYNPRTTRMGEKVGLGFNNTNTPLLFSFNNLAFRIKESANNSVLPEYLYINFTRNNFDRFARINSWGSATEIFSYDDLFSFQIPLPSIETQKELVAVYNGLKELAEENEKLLKPLEESCQAFIVDCKKKYPMKKLGDYIIENREKNTEGVYSKVMGLSTQKQFREPNSRVNKDELHGYKITENNSFAFVPTTDTWKVFACALNKGETIVVSPIYCVFKLVNEETFLADFLSIYFKRKEFDRYVRFNSWGSARENFNFDDLCDVKIPVPPLEIQQKIVDLYNCYEECKRISTTAREKIKNLCPALVQKAAHSE